MPGRIATKDRIKYQFRVFGAPIIVYIEVRLEVGTGDEQLNAVTQLIAEADGVYVSPLTPVTCLDIY